MGTPFWKMHGAGNDFILVDDRHCKFPERDAPTIAALCQRRTGIGSEGLILLQTSTVADFRMRFFNPDGHEVDMCGNGARCVARLACDLHVAAPSMRIETRAGTLLARVDEDSVQLTLPEPSEYQSTQTLAAVAGQDVHYAFLNTGVPHAIVLTESLDTDPVFRLGRAIRDHAQFAPSGTNVDFVQIDDEHHIRVRTYERGVENETLACGTGILAAAVTAALQNRVQPPVTVRAASGDLLIVDFRILDGTVLDLTLTGPAAYVFSGILALPPDERPTA